ncbi:hypothetical protein INR49_003511 [Caranx melampygus]|nr:hypothetical protein INR49_003511 [Caranx melampygus]
MFLYRAYLWRMVITKETTQDKLSGLGIMQWLFGEITCQLYAMCGVLFGLCSLTNLTALSLVCCLKVCFPNHGNKFSSSHARLLVVGVWCYASVFAVGPLVQWGHYSAEPYGTACCIDWHAPNHELSALSYIVCLFVFCYALPCTVIFLSYTFILLTVRGSRQAVQQHVSPQTKTTNAHALIVKVRGYQCRFSATDFRFCTWQGLSRIRDTVSSSLYRLPGAWTPYAAVAMWAAFGDATQVPATAFAMAAISAKSSTIYNPMVYLLCKPNFRECLYRDTSMLRQRIYRGSPLSDPKECFGSNSQRKDMSVSTRLSNGQQESYGACLHCADNAGLCHVTPAQRTACILSGSSYREVTVGQLSAKPRADFL